MLLSRCFNACIRAPSAVPTCEKVEKYQSLQPSTQAARATAACALACAGEGASGTAAAASCTAAASAPPCSHDAEGSR